MPTVWRLNIKTAAEETVDPRKFCIEKQILGVGWPVYIPINNDWDAYYQEAQRIYEKEMRDKGWWPAANALRFRMKINDLCWTRDLSGIYYLGRIKSEWRYEEANEYSSADVLNVRDCDWNLVGKVDSVPGKVVNSYFRGRTVQVVNDESVETYSSYLYNKFQNSEFYELPSSKLDFFKMLSAEDCEDLVGLYLQEKGYLIIPSSCKINTAAYEYVMIHAKTGDSAVAQVKQGEIDIQISDYSAIPGQVFLFTTHGKYLGNPHKNVSCLSPKEIFDFAKRNFQKMSGTIRRWLSITEKMNNQLSK